MLKDKELIEIYNNSSNYFYDKKKFFSVNNKHWKLWYNSQNFTLENLKNLKNSKGELSGGLDSTNGNFSFKFYSEIINKVSNRWKCVE